MTIDIPTGAGLIMRILEEAGYKAYIVGGCVRDSLLGKTPHDWDICTSATPEEVIKILDERGIRVLTTGLKHGTVTAMYGTDQFEITTFRTESGYSDNRHPDTVEFVSDIKADLARRDFTINAMAYNDTEGLIDPYGGRVDLKYGVINCVGNPYERFSEDALRILRAMRFASTYNFGIEEKTSEAIHRSSWRLKNVSAERIRDELCKMLMGDGAIYMLIQYNDVITRIIPELYDCLGFEQNNPYHCYDVYHHIAHAVDNYEGDDISVKMALLLHDIGKPHCYSEDENGGHFYGHGVISEDIAEKVLDRLKFDNKTKDEVLELVLFHDSLIAPTFRAVRRWMNKLKHVTIQQLMAVKKADILAHSNAGKHYDLLKECDEVLRIAEQVVIENQCFKLKDLAVNGHDVMSFGFSGKNVGYILDHLLNKVIDGELENDREALMAELGRNIYRSLLPEYYIFRRK